jgi:hypothetical protein
VKKPKFVWPCECGGEMKYGKWVRVTMKDHSRPFWGYYCEDCGSVRKEPQIRKRVTK